MRKVLALVLWFLRLPFAKNEMGGKGQVAIFAALIFQVLFIFFAMVVNVGLVVHHKINLQNSVDLAAYYGAMKQAEGMSAVAHMNYQIRQSWKLMVFRLRGIGMAGAADPTAPYNAVTQAPGSNFNSDTPDACPAVFCNNYPAWNFMRIADPPENLCSNMCTGLEVTLPGTPFAGSAISGLVMAALPSIISQVDQISSQAVQQVRLQCEKTSALSWFSLGRYIFSFKNDVYNRKKVLNTVANGMSYETGDFLDLDGESVRAGVLQTLWKNMTYQNQASLDPSTGSGEGSFEMYNSLGAPGCNGSKGNPSKPPAWLSEVFIKPLYAFMDADCGDKGQAKVMYRAKILNAPGDENLPNYKDQLGPQVVQFIRDTAMDPVTFDSDEARLWHTTAGYEKNPWCMAYVKVKATTKPKIPFSPFSGITLTASAYAKPFGGSIGPWFYKNWPSSADQSTGGKTDQIDQTLPPRVRSGETPDVNAKDDVLRIDHARFVGDDIGVKSNMTTGRYTQAIWKKHAASTGSLMSLTWWGHLMDGTSDLSSMSSHGDILAWDNGKDPGIRTLEIGAIIPDQFDLAYYSIEPYFWRTYAQRIQKRSDMSNLQVRGDLGFRKDAPVPWNHFSVKDQMAKALPDGTMDYNTLTYFAGREKDPAEAFTEVLTGWHNKVPGDYSLDSERFGKCYANGIVLGDPTEVAKAVPGNCIAGGRVGYSVKLVDEEFLTQTMEIGGKGNSGRIKNLPPGM